jgi:hypothetical protein
MYVEVGYSVERPGERLVSLVSLVSIECLKVGCVYHPYGRVDE